MKSDLYLPGMGNMSGEPASVKMGDLEITCTYGSHRLPIPFILKLRKFEIERYPGSNSPSSFASEVTLIDTEQSIEEERRIYMNNVLKHRGYRFYQSSYDQDELGTVLSVNRDSVGTRITYIGYFFLMLGMFLALFARRTRFARLARSSNGTKVKAAVISALIILGGSSLFAQGYPAPSKEQAKEFGQLWVQGKEGRFKPMNTLSNEIIRKVTGSANMEGLNADQILMGMILYPSEWKAAPLFEVDNAEIHMLLGFKGAKVCFNDFLPDGNYLLYEFVNNAYNKKVPERTEFDKEVMKLDERVNILYMAQNGGMLRIFPNQNAENNTWMSLSELLEPGNTGSDTLVQVFLAYTDAIRTGDEVLASEINNFIGNYQLKNCDILPKENRKKAEIYYNKSRLFNRLAPFYALFGFILIIVQFLRIFKPGRFVSWMFRIGIIHLSVAFGLHTMALGLRWYIGGHAPLSNGYESMIFVSWISLLAGLIFVRKSGFAISLTAILSALSLLVAHLSWMNPDITNLVPVLKSPWLTIHVTVIMAGYGFLGLSALAGLINLVFYSIQNRKNSSKIKPVIDQITAVNHMSVIVGLYFLTAGVFLGGVWANESWGRYWGWDPKETWALISVLVYAFIAHMHNFPGLKGGYAFNLGSLLGYSAILMTYFGVNYFLGGMHSYAGGTKLEIPWYTTLIIGSIIALAAFAYRRQRQFQHDYLDDVEES
jgi:cytochrome c-type biogenesis protein CcsB